MTRERAAERLVALSFRRGIVTKIPVNQKSQWVYDILVEECGAPDDRLSRLSFGSNWPCWEYRFQGKLGFGGKVWGNAGAPYYVNCYPEDMTDERRVMIDAANKRLAGLTDG